MCKKIRILFDPHFVLILPSLGIADSSTKMSVTTTSNPTTTELHRTLDDYTIHLTGRETEVLKPRSQPVVENPEDWPEDYHNVPAYRPINRHLDEEERPGGTHPIERVFIFTMLHGVWLNAVSWDSNILEYGNLCALQTVAQTWRKTGGRINGTFFRYKIGGEW